MCLVVQVVFHVSAFSNELGCVWLYQVVSFSFGWMWVGSSCHWLLPSVYVVQGRSGFLVLCSLFQSILLLFQLFEFVFGLGCENDSGCLNCYVSLCWFRVYCMCVLFFHLFHFILVVVCCFRLLLVVLVCGSVVSSAFSKLKCFQ